MSDVPSQQRVNTMANELQLRRPWLVAVWSGMGNVALNAGIYLLAKMRMTTVAEFDADELFDIEHIDVREGLIHLGRRPRNRFFVWRDRNERHDLVVFVGEAQPPIGKYRFCCQLMDYAQSVGVERVFTFAAMATQMHPRNQSRVFVAASDAPTLDELRECKLEVLENGQISGLNGVLLGVAQERGIRGACLLGEMPHIFTQLPFPKASLAILRAFASLAGIEIDFTELTEQADVMEQQLHELLARVEDAYGQPLLAPEEGYRAEPAEEERLSSADQVRVERLFDEAAKDRAKAFELKKELDRLGVFREYEDRFLDLFKKSE